MRKTSHKSQRINGEVQKELSRIIRMELKDPRINPMTSVTDVMVTQDLKYCKAYISVLGDAESGAETLKGLEQASGLSAASWRVRSISEIHRSLRLYWTHQSSMEIICLSVSMR